MTLLVVLAFVLDLSPFQKIEYLTYDLRSALRQKKPSAPIVIVGIDDVSIEKYGKWPFSRSYVAEMVHKLRAYEAKTIGVGILYSKAESENDRGLSAIREIVGKIDKDPTALKDPHVLEIKKSLIEAEHSLNTDPAFTDALEVSKNVVLPLLFHLTDNAESEDKKPPAADHMMKNSVKTGGTGTFVTARGAGQPMREFAAAACALGHINIVPDSDGVVRGELPLVRYKDRLFPSFAFALALSFKGSSVGEITINGSVKAAAAGLTIPVDKQGMMLISYASAEGFPYYSFLDVMGDKVTGTAFKDKIVLIGLTATGRGVVNKTPLRSNINNIEIMATAVENILNSNHITRPWWLSYVELLIMLAFWDIISFLIPRFKASAGAAIAAGVLILWGVICIYLFYSSGLWVKMSYPMLVLVFGYMAVMSNRYIQGVERPKGKDIDSRQTNKMLGLSLQGQGQLDAAFEKFRECSLQDATTKELLYNLGQDFEKKGMSDKAQAVYEYALSAGDYKDLAQKMKKLSAPVEETAPAAPPQDSEATVVVMGASGSRASLGRYEVIKELGRGAMGVVFLGKDPKINREVAIKTLSYDDIDSDQVAEVKTRFFREAEAAGKLSHPNIVRVYDVGDDKDAAYMAMELLEGADLTRYCAKDSRLPFGEVLRVVTRVGEALDYAHQNGVVHRDIKPANIMLLNNKELRVTDFGIARVMESSKTQTGMVLGTPSYMSPEQIAGRKVDGRSDLFSLGVVFFELLVGERPFKGDSIATLMYNITSTPPTPIKQIEPRIPMCVVQIIEKLLQKNAEDRYSRGKDLVEAINQCKKTLVKRTAPSAQ
ncbi:MAG: CHASE2 domain-containing protein [Nitrospirae bacterium]|nr:CHASE2 domain-containing protein [Nitrospirota bacterium]